MIKKIIYNDQLFAIIIKNNFNKSGIHFFTESTSSQQLGYMKRPKDYIIEPHRHNYINRNISLTQEVLFIKSGVIRVDFYDDNQEYKESCILETGDVILLSSGGHGFTLLEESEIFEVKQGPYLEEIDKVHFNKIDEKNIKII